MSASQRVDTMYRIMRGDHPTKNWDSGFVAGLWYALEQLVLYRDDEDTALWIASESGIPKKEFEDNLKETQFHVDELQEKIIDKL